MRIGVLAVLVAGCSTAPAVPPPAPAPTAVAVVTPEDHTLFPVAHPSEKVSAFTRLLDQRLEAKDPAAAEKIDSEIRTKFERTLGVMITDMSGMTELTKSRGILGILELIREMQHVTVP